jgi:hypothetical protein
MPLTIRDTGRTHGHSGHLREIIVNPSGRGCYNSRETAHQMAGRLLAELAIVKAGSHQSRSKKAKKPGGA